MSVSDIMRRLKERSDRILMEEFGELRKRYSGGHFWGIDYDAWSMGNTKTEEMIQEYLEYHRKGRTVTRILFWTSLNTL